MQLKEPAPTSQPTIYMNYVIRLMNAAIRLNEERGSFPVWGTCLGFETMLLALSNMTTLLTYKLGDVNFIHPVKFNRNLSSAFNAVFSSEDFDLMEQNALFCFYHEYGFMLDETLANEYVSENINILASQITERGDVVVAAYQHKKYPFIGVQYHPERTQFGFSDNSRINKTEFAIDINRIHGKIFWLLLQDTQIISNFQTVMSHKQDMWYTFNNGQQYDALLFKQKEAKI